MIVFARGRGSCLPLVLEYTADSREHTIGEPTGTELRRNVVNEWTRAVHNHDNMALLTSSIFTAAKGWKQAVMCPILRPNGCLQSLQTKLRADAFA